MLGAYVGAVLASLLAGILVFALGGLLYDLLLRRVTGLNVAGTQGEGNFLQLTLTLGLSLVLQNGGLIVFGSSPQTLRTPLSSSAWELGIWGSDAMLFLNKARTRAHIIFCALIEFVRAQNLSIGLPLHTDYRFKQD